MENQLIKKNQLRKGESTDVAPMPPLEDDEEEVKE